MANINTLTSAVQYASYNMVSQLLGRILTFILNAVVLRHISKELLGVVNVRLTLLYSTILFVTREPSRRACLSKTAGRNWAQVINMLWLELPFNGILVLVFSYIWIAVLEQPDEKTVPNYQLGAICFALSALIDLLKEPLYVIGQALLFVRLQVFGETLLVFMNGVISAVLIISFPNLGIVAFFIGRMISSTLCTLMYYGYFIFYIRKEKPSLPEDFPFKSLRDFFPKSTNSEHLVDWNLVKLAWSFFKQSFLKQILTEGERYIITVFGVLNFGDQGVFDVITNLGSLAARFIFLPIEDSAYLFFSQSLTRGLTAKEQPKDSLKLATQVLQNLLTGVTLIGATFLSFGYAYSYLLLDIYGGQILSSGTGPSLLRWYCIYVLILAVNGVTEGFVFAAMSQKEVDKYNHKMLVFSAIFLLSSWYLATVMGSIGFVLANCLTMCARIVHSLYYITKYYQNVDHNPLKGLIPSYSVMAAYGVSFLVTAWSEMTFCCDAGWGHKLIHISIGGFCLGIVLIFIYISEKNLVQFIKEKYREKQRQKKSD